jgi:hypothetical protein
MTETTARSEIYVTEPLREGNGTSRLWSRTIAGVAYSFTAVTMPDGERRYFVSRYNGYRDDGTEWGRTIGMQFGCAWTPVHSIIVKPKTANVRARLAERGLAPEPVKVIDSLLNSGAVDPPEQIDEDEEEYWRNLDAAADALDAWQAGHVEPEIRTGADEVVYADESEPRWTEHAVYVTDADYQQRRSAFTQHLQRVEQEDEEPYDDGEERYDERLRQQQEIQEEAIAEHEREMHTPPWPPARCPFHDDDQICPACTA